MMGKKRFGRPSVRPLEAVMDAAGVTAITFVVAMLVGMPIFFGVIAWLAGRRA